MNRSEQAFFYELKRQLPEGYFIFPKMRIADFIEPCNGRGFYYRRNQILPKHIDFLICNQNFEPIVALEVNGFSHRRFDRMLRDDAVRRIFKDAGMHLEFIEVGTNFEARIAEIFSTFKHPSQTPTTHLIP